jgi:putative DNA primase/helicase
MTRSIADDLEIQTLAETEIELREHNAKLEDEACWQSLIARCAIEDLHTARKRHASLERQHQALKDEYKAHRERTMRASLSSKESDADAAAIPKPQAQRRSLLSVNASDEALLTRARRAQNGSQFCRLFDHGDWQGAGYGSQSEADMALVSYLASWTGGDSARVDSLFRRSGLYREKWDAPHLSGRETYGGRTIVRANCR